MIGTYLSGEDVCGDDHVRVVSVIYLSVYYPYLSSVRVDGFGVSSVNRRVDIGIPVRARRRAWGL